MVDLAGRTAFGKPPPHCAEVEQALLGAILNFPDGLADAPWLAASDFYEPLHAAIFASLVKRWAAGQPVDPVALRREFEGCDPIGDMPIPAYLARLKASALTLKVGDYARSVKDLSIRRALMRLGAEIAATASSQEDVSAAAQIEAAETALYALAQRGTAERVVTFDAAMKAALASAHTAYQRGTALAGLSTGLIDLDVRLGGLQPTDLIIVGGRPGMGKSALAMTIAVQNARRAGADGCPVGVFSMEMSAQQLAMRVLAESAEINSHLLRTGRIEAAQWPAIKDAAEAAGGYPIVIEETGALSIAQLAISARRMQRKHRVGLVIVDYLQLMRGSGRRQDTRTQDLTEITTGLKALAKELEVPVVALSQLNRGLESRADKRPQLADLRESGSIEQDADVVLFVFREAYYLSREEPPLTDSEAYAEWQARMRAASGKAEIIIAKQRHGPTGIVKVAFEEGLTRFSSATTQEHPHERPIHGV